MTTLVCGYCEKVFELKPSVARWRAKKRMEQSGSSTLFCSNSCGVLSHAGSGLGGSLSFKRRSWMSDEVWFYEKTLVELGLGMDRGISKLVIYTLDNPFKDPDY